MQGQVLELICDGDYCAMDGELREIYTIADIEGDK
ncbi:hypothetical protein N007_07210 [Alicyclobacillus acidoterrestris ATCC 49025]|nr:hypothetical protein N007_07210 [Alicyclobacillus acidoterrestris ATCC 49025]